MKKLLFTLLLILALPTLTLAAERIEINTASLQQLDGLVGVGPVIAQRIIDSRPYNLVDDLLRVKDIGEKTLQKIKDQGLAYVSAQAQTPTYPPTTTYPAGVIINRLMPSPKGADEADEWIELKNTTGEDIDLSNWKLQDTQGAITTFSFPKSTIIAQNGFLVLKRTETKIILNNDQDELQLLFPNGMIINSVSYSNAKTDQTYSKTATGWQWTGGIAKVTALPKAKKTDNKISVAPPSVNEPLKNPFTADLKDSNTQNPWLLFLIAIGITITAGATVLILKLILRPTV